jgi:MtN3 and saliva related transmembrane protein
MTGVDMPGYSAGAITSLTFLPQVIKTRKVKSAKDISLLMFVIAAINEVMWIFYGAVLIPANWVIIWTSVIVLSMALTMIYFKLKYK